MIVSEIRGDLVATLAQAIENPNHQRTFIMGQGCNCFIRQGSGIAGQLRRFPEVYQADIDYGREGDPLKLGEFSVALFDKHGTVPQAAVFNLYTQFSMGTRERHAEYSAIKEGVRAMVRYLEDNDDKIYLPLIGAGLAGGDWEIIRHIIDKASGNKEIVIVHFEEGTLIDW
ncbi:hypothetical protein [Vibrio phage TCU-VP03-AIR1]|uniref:Macro domain-containing protein n=2 Tax=Schizotequatrovirus KVP40 TaxID=1914019 RepID=A0A6H0X955_9CAUD|nr:hypothetical protein pp2_090 [Vibrio phage phi-pp2]QIW90942.1 hypothetical protein COHAPHLL_00079 [Vibrio phage V09]